MSIAQHYTEEIDRVVRAELELPGLMPFWSSAQARTQVPPDALAKLEPLLATPHALAATPPSAWLPELLYAWRLGLVYLRDATTTIAEPVAIAARRVILRDVRVDPFCTLYGSDILMKGTYLGTHNVVEGPAVVAGCRVRHHVSLGPLVVIERSSFEPFTKVVRFVHIDKSLIASHCAIEGGTHPEQVALGEHRRRLGCRIGPDAWVGQHVSVIGGAVIGRGSVVATHTAVMRKHSDFVLLSGSPTREFPIDFNVRGLAVDQAFAEGRAQGILAINLPVFGEHHGTFVSPSKLEIDYPDHGFLRDVVSVNLLHFQRGVFQTALAAFLPEHDVSVDFETGTTVRFHVEISPPVRPELIAAATVTPAMFRKDLDAGMLVAKADPTFLATTWKWLVNHPEPLPPFKPHLPSVVAVQVPMDGQVSPVTLAILTGMIGRLTNQKEPVGADTPFHALGMDSLVAAELAVSVEQQFNVAAPDVFRNNTARKLTLAIERAQRA